MTAIGTIKYERAIKNDHGGYTFRDVTAKVESLLAAIDVLEAAGRGPDEEAAIVDLLAIRKVFEA